MRELPGIGDRAAGFRYDFPLRNRKRPLVFAPELIAPAFLDALDREGRKKAEERAGDSEVLGLGRQKKKEGGG